MADAYGTLVFNHSENAVFDKQAIISAMNEYNWDNEGGKWLLEDDEDIFFNSWRSQYPTVFVSLVASYTIKTNDGFVQKTLSEMSDEDWDKVYDSEDEVVPLSVLRDAIAPHIKEGWVQIACTANEKQRYVYMQQLKVSADGKAEREERLIGNGTGFNESIEEV